MHLSKPYKKFIFDCDGVILDSNNLKIQAMRASLSKYFSDKDLISDCLDYFRKNFGKSRFHHINHFLDSILFSSSKEIMKKKLLTDYSDQCRFLYSTANVTPGVISFIKHCNGKKYVASGSEQSELRNVFSKRGLDSYFDGIYGSPTPKIKIIENILAEDKCGDAIMFGDSHADMIAAQENNIDFVFYSPLSNVKKEMIEICNQKNHYVIDDFNKLRAYCE